MIILIWETEQNTIEKRHSTFSRRTRCCRLGDLGGITQEYSAASYPELLITDESPIKLSLRGGSLRTLGNLGNSTKNVA